MKFGFLLILLIFSLFIFSCVKYIPEESSVGAEETDTVVIENSPSDSNQETNSDTNEEIKDDENKGLVQEIGIPDCPSQAPYPTKEACSSSCQGDCVVGAAMRTSTETLTCYRCDARFPTISCEDRCETLGMEVGRSQNHDDVLSWLQENAYCKTANIDSAEKIYPDGCSCFKSQIDVGPELSCRRTVCGDVACNSSVKCGRDNEITVTCSWTGWKWLGDQVYQSQVWSTH